MARFLALLLFWLLATSPAWAGAWTRDKGSGFVSTVGVLRGPSATPQYETRIYGEYGVFRHLTLGVDLNQKAVLREDDQMVMLSGHALIFARVPLAPTSWRMRYALEVGTGLYVPDTSLYAKEIVKHRMSTVALAVGRGFDSPFGPGWFSAQTTIERRAGLPDPIHKLDASVGLSNERLFRPMLKIEASRMADDPVAWSMTPAVLIRSGKEMTWVLGIERKFGTRPSIGIELGLWREF